MRVEQSHDSQHSIRLQRVSHSCQLTCHNYLYTGKMQMQCRFGQPFMNPTLDASPDSCLSEATVVHYQYNRCAAHCCTPIHQDPSPTYHHLPTTHCCCVQSCPLWSRQGWSQRLAAQQGPAQACWTSVGALCPQGCTQDPGLRTESR